MITRDFGPFRFTLEPAQGQPQVLVSLYFTGTLLWQHVFTPPSADCRLDVSEPGLTKRGELIAQFSGSGDSGQLQAVDLVLQAPGFGTTFTGTIAIW